MSSRLRGVSPEPIAYTSNESGGNEIYVRRVVVSADGTPAAPESSKRLISNGARRCALAPRWTRAGLSCAGDRMMAVELSPSAELGLRPPRPLFTVPPEYLRNQPGPALMDVMPDASRFLLATPPKEAPRTALEVVFNWR